MKFETLIAKRYLASRNKPFFTSFLLFISLLGVSAGVFALIFVMSVMNGFEVDFQKRILGFKAPVVIESEGGKLPDAAEILAADPRILRAVPYIEGEAVLQTEAGGALGARIRGISSTPSAERLGQLYLSDSFSEESVILGDGLATDLKVYPDFFEKIRLVFPVGDVGPSGDLVPRVRTVTMVGKFRSGFFEYDSKYALISYSEAKRLFGSEGRTGIEVWVEPLAAADAVKKALAARLPPELEVRTWIDQSPKLFAAMKLEKIGMFLLLAALLLIASFNIFGLSSLAVMNKMRDMAVLRSVGVSRRTVRRIFLAMAAGIGVSGALAGGIVGFLVTSILQSHPLRLPSTYYVEYLPIVVDWGNIALVLCLVPVLTMLAGCYPAWEAGRPSPVDVLRHE